MEDYYFVVVEDIGYTRTWVASTEEALPMPRHEAEALAEAIRNDGDRLVETVKVVEWFVYEPPHQHTWGPVETAPMTGTPHRKCTDCRGITLNLSDEED